MVDCNGNPLGVPNMFDAKLLVQNANNAWRDTVMHHCQIDPRSHNITRVNLTTGDPR
jgi:hypothetical protein